MIHSANTTRSYPIPGGTDIEYPAELTEAARGIIDIVNQIQRADPKKADFSELKLADRAHALQTTEVVANGSSAIRDTLHSVFSKSLKKDELPSYDEIESKNGKSAARNGQNVGALVIEKIAVFTKEAIVTDELEQSVKEIECLLKELPRNEKGEIARKVMKESGISDFYHHAVTKNQSGMIAPTTRLWRVLLDAEGGRQKADFGIQAALYRAMMTRQHQSIKNLTAAVNSLSDRFLYDHNRFEAGFELRSLYRAAASDLDGVDAQVAAILTIRRYVEMLSKACGAMPQGEAQKLYEYLHKAQTGLFGRNEKSFNRLKSIDHDLTSAIKTIKNRLSRKPDGLPFSGKFADNLSSHGLEWMQYSERLLSIVKSMDVDDFIEEKMLRLRLRGPFVDLQDLQDLVDVATQLPEIKRTFVVERILNNRNEGIYFEAVEANQPRMIELATQLYCMYNAQLWCMYKGSPGAVINFGIGRAICSAMTRAKPELLKKLSEALVGLSSNYVFNIAAVLAQEALLRRLFSESKQRSTREKAIVTIREYINMVDKSREKMSSLNANTLAKTIGRAKKAGIWNGNKSSYDLLMKSEPALIKQIETLLTNLQRT